MSDFVIARKGAAQCQIIPGAEMFQAAARALEQYLSRITGAETFSQPRQTKILFRQAAAYGPCGFAYRVEGDSLVLEAENALSAQYAAYDLLERLAGCRFYASDAEKVPENPDLSLCVEDYAFQPILGYRELYYRDYDDPAFAAKRKMDPMQVVPHEAHARWGFWCHSFGRLLPAQDYFDQHPEYFALIDGERRRDGQLCLSNPEVLEIVCQHLAEHIAAQPDKLYWSVSQDDNNNYCQCPACQALDARDGGPIGSILTFVNQVAARFPDKIISTLAYWYSRKAPKVTRPASNVHIMLCNIEALRGEPIETDPRNEGSVQELRDWAKICGNVFLWDYPIQFANLVSPFPNLNTLAPNIRFFVENSVRSLFSQCNREIGGEFAELRGYMLAKLMWDPYDDPRAIMEDFVEGYYGAAGPYILRYIDAMHQASHASGAPLGIFHGPMNARSSYLTESLCREYALDFDAAEAAVAGNPTLLRRVRIARLPLLYAQLALGYGSREERLGLAARFARAAREQGLVKVEEWRMTVDQFLTDTLANLGHDRLEFGRETLPALRLAGFAGTGGVGEIFGANQHRVQAIGRLIQQPTVAHDYTLYSLPREDGSSFVGLALREDAGALPEGYLEGAIDGGDYVTLRCEEKDLPVAYAAVEGYLAAQGLKRRGEIACRITLKGIYTLLIPVA